MRKITSVLITAVLFGLNISCQNKPQSPIEELKSIGAKMKEIDHVKYSYQIDEFRSYSGKGQPLKGDIYFEAYPKDSIIGMRFYNSSYPYDMFYNGEFVVDMNKADSSIFKSPLVQLENGHGSVIPYLELSYCAIKNFLNDPNLTTEVDSLVKRDTIINNKACTYYTFGVNQKFISTHKSYDKRQNKVELIFQKDNSLPIYYSITDKFKRGTVTNTNFVEARFFNFDFKTTYPISSFDIESIPAYYDWSKVKLFLKTLEDNSIAPKWILPTLEGDSLSLCDYKGKYVLLDFWYIGCGACIKAVPTLNKIQHMYGKDKLVVVGVNCFSKEQSKVKIYCSNQDMQYQNVWQGDLIAKKYKINAAPIFYLINPDGEIVYSQIGFDEGKLLANIQEFVK